MTTYVRSENRLRLNDLHLIIRVFDDDLRRGES